MSGSSGGAAESSRPADGLATSALRDEETGTNDEEARAIMIFDHHRMNVEVEGEELVVVAGYILVS